MFLMFLFGDIYILFRRGVQVHCHNCQIDLSIFASLDPGRHHTASLKLRASRHKGAKELKHWNLWNIFFEYRIAKLQNNWYRSSVSFCRQKEHSFPEMQTVRSGWANWCASFRFSWSFSQPLYHESKVNTEIPQRNLWIWILSLNLSRKLKPSTTEMLMLQPLVKRRKRRSKANSVAWVKANSWPSFDLEFFLADHESCCSSPRVSTLSFHTLMGIYSYKKHQKNSKFTSFSAFFLSVIFFRSICDWVCCRFTLSTCTTSCLNLRL